MNVELSRRLAYIADSLLEELGSDDYFEFAMTVHDVESFDELSDDYKELFNKFENNDLHDHNHFDHIPAIKNEFDEEEVGLIQTQQGSLQNAIMSIDARLTAAVLDYIFRTNNEFEQEKDVLPPEEKNEYISELALALAAFYGIIIPIYASSTMAARAKEFGMTGSFKMNSDVKKYIKEVADKAAESHIETILEDLRVAVKEAYDTEVQSILDGIKAERSVTDADLVLARKKALEGASRPKIVNAVKQKYADKISDARAKAIARTETNRAFTQSQFNADLQFIKQNDLEGKAYKKWTTRSDNPCAICVNLASQGPIPFKTNFASIGDVLSATYVDDKGQTRVLKQPVTFEDLSAGNAHVNCSCRYILIIQ